MILTIVSIAFLSSATELHELFRLPQLFAHFKDHYIEDPSMDLGEYIALHYINDHPNDQDDQEDNELPFKDHLAQHVDIAVLPGLMEIHYFMDQTSINSPGKIGIPQLQPYSIFRPPQLV